MQVILDHGKLRPPEIMALLSVHDSKSSCRCYHSVPALTLRFLDAAVYQQALYRLISGAYLKPSTLLSHISPRDKQIKYEAEERAKIPGLPTAKALRETKETAAARLRREEEEAEKVGLVSLTL